MKGIKHLTDQELNNTMEPARRNLGKLHSRLREQPVRRPKVRVSMGSGGAAF